jgi:hypothetical protein
MPAVVEQREQWIVIMIQAVLEYGKHWVIMVIQACIMERPIGYDGSTGGRRIEKGQWVIMVNQTVVESERNGSAW